MKEIIFSFFICVLKKEGFVFCMSIEMNEQCKAKKTQKLFFLRYVTVLRKYAVLSGMPAKRWMDEFPS